MTDADDAVVLDVIGEWLSQIDHEDPDEQDILDALRSMPDKGPLVRALGITPGDLGLEPGIVGNWTDAPMRKVWVEP